MSEMLGNKYFYSRDYLKATETLEQVLLKNPNNKNVSKKLIICYSQIGKIDKALNLFYDTIQKDIDHIICTDPESDDCPCPELVRHYGNILPFEDNSIDLKIMLGMLWLFCDIEKSYSFFQSVKEIKPNDKRIYSICEIIGEKFKQLNQNVN